MRCCHECGSTFKTYNRAAMFCSRICFGAAHRIAIHSVCIVCEKSFMVPPSAIKSETTTKYCSRECKHRHHQANVIPRFLSKIEVTDSCWIWTGRIGAEPKPYGSFYTDGKDIKAHRFAYELFIRKIPDGLTIDHLCRNHSCVNPSHLEAVTNRENILRGVSIVAKQARKTHCKNGHPLIAGNLVRSVKHRECLICRRATAMRYYYRNSNPDHRYTAKSIKR